MNNIPSDLITDTPVDLRSDNGNLKTYGENGIEMETVGSSSDEMSVTLSDVTPTGSSEFVMTIDEDGDFRNAEPLQLYDTLYTPEKDSTSLPDDHSLSVTKGERSRLVFMLFSVLFATVGVIIWGTVVTNKIMSLQYPVVENILENFLGAEVTSVKGSLRPQLGKIPSKPVEEGEIPGAAENETAPENYESQENITEDVESLPVRRVDLSVDSSDVFALINETPYVPDVISLYAEDLKTMTKNEAKVAYGADAPQVLVLHTHGTESYFDGGETYSSDEPFRTYDTDKNVVAVGRAFAERLMEHGIGVIHIETMFDGENYNEAYVRSAAEVRRITEKYPSVEYVFDIHRDAMFTRDGVNLAPTSPLTVGGENAAQIMLVVGTDYAGAPHSEWEDNLSFALKLQKSALRQNGALMRGINLRSASFNAQYAKGAVLVEIGAAGNTFDEALRASEIFADGVAEVITGGK